MKIRLNYPNAVQAVLTKEANQPGPTDWGQVGWLLSCMSDLALRDNSDKSGSNRRLLNIYFFVGVRVHQIEADDNTLE